MKQQIAEKCKTNVFFYFWILLYFLECVLVLSAAADSAEIANDENCLCVEREQVLLSVIQEKVVRTHD